jgi:hypothetical protein
VCGAKHCAKGLCARHHWKLVTHGDANAPDLRRKGTAEERFWRFVTKTDSCWLWTGRLNHAGYGIFAITSGRTVRAHRFSYELIYDAIPEGAELDHLCRVRDCVNPNHLEPVTHLENVRRSGPATRTTCSHGHPLDDDNVYRDPGGNRHCRQCGRMRGREYRERLRLKSGRATTTDYLHATLEDAPVGTRDTVTIETSRDDQCEPVTGDLVVATGARPTPAIDPSRPWRPLPIQEGVPA